MAIAALAGVGFLVRKYQTMAVISAVVVVFNAIIVLLQEVTQEFSTKLDELTGYTVIESNPAEGNRASTVLANNGIDLTVTSMEPLVATNDNRTMLAIQATFGERKISLLSAHATRPIDSSTNRSQEDELEMMASWSQRVRCDGSDVLIVGDLNMTPWSPRYKRLLNDDSLIESMNGYGLQNTWPSSAPTALRVPIDNAAHSVGIDIWSRTIFPVDGSNHSALRFKVVVRP